jgi:hypothetical protein
VWEPFFRAAPRKGFRYASSLGADVRGSAERLQVAKNEDGELRAARSSDGDAVDAG